VQFAGGSPNVVVRYLPLMLFGTARQWINDWRKIPSKPGLTCKLCSRKTSRVPTSDLTI
jgi:hypothetical protein